MQLVVALALNGCNVSRTSLIATPALQLSRSGVACLSGPGVDASAVLATTTQNVGDGAGAVAIPAGLDGNVAPGLACGVGEAAVMAAASSDCSSASFVISYAVSITAALSSSSRRRALQAVADDAASGFLAAFSGSAPPASVTPLQAAAAKAIISLATALSAPQTNAAGDPVPTALGAQLGPWLAQLGSPAYTGTLLSMYVNGAPAVSLNSTNALARAAALAVLPVIAGASGAGAPAASGISVAIIGGAVGGGVALLLIGALAAVAVRRRRAQQRVQREATSLRAQASDREIARLRKQLSVATQNPLAAAAAAAATAAAEPTPAHADDVVGGLGASRPLSQRLAASTLRQQSISDLFTQTAALVAAPNIGDRKPSGRSVSDGSGAVQVRSRSIASSRNLASSRSLALAQALRTPQAPATADGVFINPVHVAASAPNRELARARSVATLTSSTSGADVGVSNGALAASARLSSHSLHSSRALNDGSPVERSVSEGSAPAPSLRRMSVRRLTAADAAAREREVEAGLRAAALARSTELAAAAARSADAAAAAEAAASRPWGGAAHKRAALTSRPSERMQPSSSVTNPLLNAAGASRDNFGAGRTVPAPAPSMTRSAAMQLAMPGQSPALMPPAPAAAPRLRRAVFAPAALMGLGTAVNTQQVPALDSPDDARLHQRALTRLASRFDAEALASAAAATAARGAATPSVMDERGRRAFAIMQQQQQPELQRSSPQRVLTEPQQLAYDLAARALPDLEED